MIVRTNTVKAFAARALCLTAAGLVLVGAAAADPAMAAKRLDWVSAGATLGAVVGGEGAVAWEPGAATTAFQRGRDPVKRLATPAGCEGGLKGASARRLLYFCGQGTSGANGFEQDIAVLDVRDGVVVRPRVTFPGEEPTEVYGLGAQWIWTNHTAYHVRDVAYVNWRTGQRIFGFRDPFGPRRYLDLNHPELGRRLCSPLRRQRNPTEETDTTPPYESLTRAGRWFLSGSQSQLKATLHRCGSAKQRTIHGALGVAGGWVLRMTYAAGDGPDRLYVAKFGKPASYTALVRRRSSLAMQIRHTAAAVYATVADGPDYDPTGHRLLVASLPGR